jgi:hypothetical protein
MIYIILSTLGILVVILGYTTFNLLRKLEKAEDIMISQSNFLENLKTQLEYTEARLLEIDAKETFRGDDEIGWFFNEIKILHNQLSQLIIK